MDDRTFGARFLDEARRLTRSTLGFDYAKLERLSRMDRDEFMEALGRHLLPAAADGSGPDPAAVEPEDLARAVLERTRSDDPMVTIVNILGGLV